MKWDRNEAVRLVRKQIWAHVSPVSAKEGTGLLTAGALLGWPIDEAAKLGDIQFLLSPQVERFVHALPALTRSLNNTSRYDEDTTQERLNGPIQWGRTFNHRNSSGDPHAFVVGAAERSLQTPENEVLVHLLHEIKKTSHLSKWFKSKDTHEPVRIIQSHVAAVERNLSSQAIRAIRHRVPSPGEVARLSRGRYGKQYITVFDAYRHWDSLIRRRDQEAIRQAIEQTGLVSTDDSVLFELLTLFTILDFFQETGWHTPPLGTFNRQVSTTVQHPQKGEILIQYQPSLRTLTGKKSKYVEVQQAHGLAEKGNDLIPDVSLQWKDSLGEHLLLVECKQSLEPHPRALRRALKDLLAYREAISDLPLPPGPYGVGVAWGPAMPLGTGDPEILLTTHMSLRSTMARIFS